MLRSNAEMFEVVCSADVSRVEILGIRGRETSGTCDPPLTTRRLELSDLTEPIERLSEGEHRLGSA